MTQFIFENFYLVVAIAWVVTVSFCLALLTVGKQSNSIRCLFCKKLIPLEEWNGHYCQERSKAIDNLTALGEEKRNDTI